MTAEGPGTVQTCMHDDGEFRTSARGRIGRVLYWLAVVLVSLALVTALLLLLESCDESTVGAAAATLR